MQWSCLCVMCVHNVCIQHNTTHIVLHNGTKVEGNWWDDCLDTSGCSRLAQFHIMWWSLKENLCSIIYYAVLLHYYQLCTWILDVLHFDDENTLWHVLIFSLSLLKENVAAVLQYHCINAPWALSIKYSIVFNIYVTLWEKWH